MKSDAEIASSISLRPIVEIGEQLGLREKNLLSYGPYKAKISLDVLEQLQPRPGAKYLAVSAITPTPLGEGKTVTTIGLSLGLNKLGKRAICTLRQPSMGPVFGIKGGATGGGYSQILPTDEINLHLTGDFHAVGVAHNLLAAALDASLFHSNPFDMAIDTISWKRTIDINDRALRNIRIGLGGQQHGIPRDSGFDITAASEVMSILTLTTGREDLRKRLADIVIGFSRHGKSITAKDLECDGAMAVLLRDAIQPNLLQTSEGSAALLHSGPFANIGPGNSSILADQIALRLADYVVTESGFGADMGLEKLFNLKCRVSGMQPHAVALVATVRALKMHSGKFTIIPGKPLDPGLQAEDLPALQAGIANLEQQIKIVRYHGVPVVVAINRFGNESEREIAMVKEKALQAGAQAAVVSEVFQKGGEGGVQLAQAMVKAANQPNQFAHLYTSNLSIREKIEVIATKLYQAKAVSFAPQVAEKIARYEELGWGSLPICMAKTQNSISHDSNLKGAPQNYTFPIVDIRAMAGAGFITPLAGSIMTMPGLGSNPGYRRFQ